MSLISDRMLNNFFARPFDLMDTELKKLAQSDFSTDMNYEIFTEDGKFFAVFNMPGHSGMEDIKADVDKDKRLLKVVSKLSSEETTEKSGRVYYHKGESQRSYKLRLPEDINLDSAHAICENGQLKVSFALLSDQEQKDQNKISLDIKTPIQGKV